MTHCRQNEEVEIVGRHGGWRRMARVCAGYLLAVIVGWTVLALVVGALVTVVVALWHAHGIMGLMLAAVLVGVAAIGVLGPRWARRMMREELGVSQQEIVDGVVAQLGKAKAEILAELEKLAAANPALDLSALVAAAQGLDDIVPDPEPEPGPEPGPVDPEFGVGGA